MSRLQHIASLSIVTPMFNEAQNIGAVLRKTLRFLDEKRLDGEIIVVNDGSSDATGELAERMAGLDRRVKALHHLRNYGLGRTIRTGFENARKDWLLYIDGDDPFDLAELEKMDQLARDHDLLIGYRLNRDEGLRRFVLSRCYRMLVHLVLGLRFRDINCAFKLVRRSVLRRVLLAAEGSFISAELVAKAGREGFRIAEVGIRYRPRTLGESTLSSPRTILRILVEMARFKFLGN